MSLISITQADDRAFYLELLEWVKHLNKFRSRDPEMIEELMMKFHEDSELLKKKIIHYNYSEDDRRRADFDNLFIK